MNGGFQKGTVDMVKRKEVERSVENRKKRSLSIWWIRHEVLFVRVLTSTWLRVWLNRCCRAWSWMKSEYKMLDSRFRNRLPTLPTAEGNESRPRHASVRALRRATRRERARERATTSENERAKEMKNICKRGRRKGRLSRVFFRACTRECERVVTRPG